MKSDFNLVDEPWIPCLITKDGRSVELGILHCLTQAPNIREIADPSPLVEVAVHRLLLAILHRVFGPKSPDAWQRVWKARTLDADRLRAYLDKVRGHFNLFDDDHPFYQSKSLDFSYEGSVSKLVHELASGNNATLFDHTTDDVELSLSPAEAARLLVAHQAFAVGGLVSLERGQDPKLYKSADNAPLVKGAVALVKGKNLFETLMLNLHHYGPGAEDFFSGSSCADASEDLPAWEREEETLAQDRWPRGYLDYLTWQSRRIRLHPELDGERLVVRKVVIMKGNQFPDGFNTRQMETMVAYRKDTRARDQDPWPAVGFTQNRAIWRDSLALLESVPEGHDRPKTLDWLNDLVAEGMLDRTLVFPLDLYGLCSDRAKVLFWRHERLPLPLAYLEDKELLSSLRRALNFAEDVNRALRSATNTLATLLLTPDSDSGAGRQPPKEEVRRVASILAPERAYWAQIETHFRQFVVELAADRTVLADGVTQFGTKAVPQWVDQVGRAAVTAFEKVTGDLDRSARTLKAVARADAELRQNIKRSRAKSGTV